MRHQPLVILIAMGIVLTMTMPAAAAQDVDPAPSELDGIIVRTYARPDVLDAMETARRAADASLRRAGVSVYWVECGVSPDDEPLSQRCERPVQSNELVVRLVEHVVPDRRSDGDALGFAYVDAKTGRGWLATVFVDRVQVMARTACINVGELLGRTLAHEIGHLLLGTNRHGGRGLMRAAWSTADLRRDGSTQWSFEQKEGETMRANIRRRMPPVATTAFVTATSMN